MARLTRRTQEQRRRADEVDLLSYFGTIRHRSTGIFSGAALGLAVGLAVVAFQQPVFTASGAVLVADLPVVLPGSATVSPRRFTMDTEAQRVSSIPVITAVQTATGDLDAQDRLTVTAVPTTKVLIVAYRSEQPSKALQGAQVAVDAYLAARREALLQRREQRTQTIEEGLTTLRDRLDDLTRSSDGSSTDSGSARREALAAELRVRQAEARRAAIATIEPGEVVRAAALDAGGGRRNVTVPPASGLFLGALLGLANVRGGSGRRDTRTHVRVPVAGGPEAEPGPEHAGPGTPLLRPPARSGAAGVLRRPMGTQLKVVDEGGGARGAMDAHAVRSSTADGRSQLPPLRTGANPSWRQRFSRPPFRPMPAHQTAPPAPSPTDVA